MVRGLLSMLKERLRVVPSLARGHTAGGRQSGMLAQTSCPPCIHSPSLTLSQVPSLAIWGPAATQRPWQPAPFAPEEKECPEEHCRELRGRAELCGPWAHGLTPRPAQPRASWGMMEVVVPGAEWFPTLECSFTAGGSPGRMGIGTLWCSWGQRREPPTPEKVWAKGRRPTGSLQKRLGEDWWLQPVCDLGRASLLLSISHRQSTPKIFLGGTGLLTGTQKAKNCSLQIGLWAHSPDPQHMVRVPDGQQSFWTCIILRDSRGGAE